MELNPVQCINLGMGQVYSLDTCPEGVYELHPYVNMSMQYYAIFKYRNFQMKHFVFFFLFMINNR